MHKKILKSYGLILLVFLWMGGICFLHSVEAEQVIHYTGDAGTDVFSDPGNWEGEVVPGAEDTAVFALSDAYEIKIREDATINRLRLHDAGNQSAGPDRLTLDLGQNTLSILSEKNETDRDSYALFFSASSQIPRILVFNGGTIRMHSFNQSTFHGTFSTAMIFKNKAKLECSGMGYVGAYGSGALYLLDGSQWDGQGGKSWVCVLGLAKDAYGLMEVSGEGSSFSARNLESSSKPDLRSFFVSAQGTGELRVLNGATFECDVVNMGNGQNGQSASATVIVDGEKSKFTVDYLHVGGGSNNVANPAQASGPALFYVSNGAEANVARLKVLAYDAGASLVGKVVIHGGALNIGTESVDCSAEFSPGSQLEFQLNEVPKQAPVTTLCPIEIKDAHLTIVPEASFKASVGTKIPLIAGEGVNGTFSSLPEGAEIQGGGYTFVIHYGVPNGEVGLTVKAVK